MIKSDLWVERWRPQTLDDYVWSSDAQKAQVASWVREGRIPHTLLVGTPGLGKCLAPWEKIKIRIDLNKIPEEIKQKLPKFKQGN